MTTRLMRAIDRFGGIPLCWITGVWHALRPRTAPEEIPSSRPVLVIKFFGMGSILLSTPLLDALRARHAAPLVFLTFAANRELVEKLPQVAVLLAVDTSSPFRFVRDTLRALAAIRRLRVQAVFDLEFFSKYSTLIGALSGAPVRVGFDLPARWRRWNLTQTVPLRHDLHVTRLFLSQIGQTQGEGPLRVTRPAATDAERAAAEQLVDDAGGSAEWIAVNINAGPTSLERRWPPEFFMQVVRALARDPVPRRFVFTGSAGERPYVAAALAGQVDLEPLLVNAAGGLTIGGLIALLERSSLLLTNDSGPMHLASAVGTAVVGLFGPESPALYAPAGDSRILYRGLACSPCLTMYNAKLFVCPYDARCMREIAPESVASAARELLAADRRRRA